MVALFWLLLSACGALAAAVLWNKPRVPPGKMLPPTPPGHWLWGHVASLLYPVETLHERLGALARNHPGIVTLRVGPTWLPRWLSPPIVVVNDPELVRSVFTGNYGAGTLEHEPEILENVQTVIGGGLLGTHGSLWKDRRSHIERNFFSIAALRNAAPVVERHIERTMDTLDTRPDPTVPIDLYKRCLIPLLLGVMTKLLFGIEVGDTRDEKREAEWRQLVEDMGVVFAEFNDRTFRPFKTWRKTSRAHRESLPRVGAYIDALIARYRREPDRNRHDMLTILTKDDGGADDNKNPYDTDEAVRCEALLFLFAGFESASSTTAYALHLLAHHPEAQEKARQEAREWASHGFDALKDLPYIEAVVREGMRLYPIAHMLTRRVTRDITAGDYFIPADTRLLFNNLGISHSADVWDDPEAFRPERWIGKREQANQFASMPFGAGIRVCPGQRLATLEVKMIMAALLQRYDFQPDPADPCLHREVAFIMRPRDYSILCLPLSSSTSLF